jgi:hypothetical protein
MIVNRGISRGNAKFVLGQSSISASPGHVRFPSESGHSPRDVLWITLVGVTMAVSVVLVWERSW